MPDETESPIPPADSPLVPPPPPPIPPRIAPPTQPTAPDLTLAVPIQYWEMKVAALGDPMQWVYGVSGLLCAIAMMAAIVTGIVGFGSNLKGAVLPVAEAWLQTVGIALGVLIALALFFLLARWISERSRARMVSQLPRSDPAFGYYSACSLYGEWPREAWWRRRRMRWITTLRAQSQARAFLRPSYLAQTAQYQIITEPIEPERIGGSFALGEMRALLIGSVVGAVMAYHYGVWTVMGVAVLVVSAFIRLLWRRALFTPIIAGQGWIEHGTSRWTIEDSVLVVTGVARADIRLIGPMGVLRLRLSMKPGADGQFATLWTRWMHPHPRLEQRSFEDS